MRFALFRQRCGPRLQPSGVQNCGGASGRSALLRRPLGSVSPGKGGVDQRHQPGEFDRLMVLYYTCFSSETEVQQALKMNYPKKLQKTACLAYCKNSSTLPSIIPQELDFMSSRPTTSSEIIKTRMVLSLTWGEMSVRHQCPLQHHKGVISKTACSRVTYYC